MGRESIAVFSPHARVLVQIGRNPDVRMRDIAEALKMTERNVQNLMRELQSAGLVEVKRRGRRNRYRVRNRKRVGQELGASMTVSRFLKLAGAAGSPDSAPEPIARSEAPDRLPASERPPPQATDDSERQRQIDWLGEP